MKEERQIRIPEKSRAEGKILAACSSEAFGVSEDAIRRDLRDLADAGKSQRVNGGALPKSSLIGSHDARALRRHLAMHRTSRLRRHPMTVIRRA